MAEGIKKTGELTFVTHEIYDDRLLYYSSWPLSQICVVILSFASDLSILHSTHLMQLFFYLASFLMAYQILSISNEKFLGANERVIFWGLTLFIALPELNYWQGECVRLGLGLISSCFCNF